MAVKAKNSAGLESDPAFSAAILMDVTPPEGIACSRFRLVTQAALARDATDQSSFSSRPVVYSKSLTFTATQHQLLKVILMFGLLWCCGILYIGYLERWRNITRIQLYFNVMELIDICLFE